MKKFSALFLLLFLFACSINPTAAPTVTLTLAPTFTSTPTFTPSPTFTATPDTSTPDTEKLLPPIETVPFNEKTYKNLPQLDVAAWEKAAGRPLTPKDIILASQLGDVTPFPSDALVVGFYPRTTTFGSIVMEPYVDKKVGADKLPMTYEAVMLTNAESMIPDAFEKKVANGSGKPTNKWLIFTWKMNTPCGELTGVMKTDGYFLDGTGGRPNLAQDFLEGTGVVAGKDDWTMTPMTKMPPAKDKADVMGSVQAEAKWEEEKVIQQKIQEAMAGADLTKEEDLAELQELFDEHWLFMGGTTDKTVEVK